MPENRQIYYSHKYFPLKVSILYIGITFLLSVFGPVQYTEGAYKYERVIILLLGVLIFLSCGYYFGVNTKDKKPIEYLQVGIKKKEEKLFRISLIISLISLVLELGYIISIGHFSLGLRALGTLYTTRIASSSNVIIFFRFLCSVFRMASLALGMYTFSSAQKKLKFLIIANTILYLLVFLFGYGNQKGVSDLVIYFGIAIYLNRIKKGKKSSKKAIGVIIIAGFLMLLLFSYMQYLRYAPRGINASNFHLFSSGEFRYNTDHIIFKIFGDRIGFGMSTILSGYLSQGYYGLSLCLQLPFVWSFGLGSSYALMSLFDHFNIAHVYELTYMGRMQSHFGRHGLRAWNTIFPWLASDFTWIGAMLIFVIVGYMMGKSWKESILYNNMISYLLFVDMVILIVFVPANNQLFHGYDSFIATWIILILWLFARRRFSHE